MHYYINSHIIPGETPARAQPPAPPPALLKGYTRGVPVKQPVPVGQTDTDFVHAA